MKKRTKVLITSVSLALLMFVHYNIDYKYTPEYEIVSEQETGYYANYRGGKVYIVKDEEDIKTLDLEEGDIVVIDQRDYEPDPNFLIIDSYKVTNKEARNDVIEILFTYEKKFPSKWKRTRKTVRLEWYVHNKLYEYGIERQHTTDVDLNNKDEEVYNNDIYNNILKI